MEKKNIIVIGLGGVGGYFGFKINKGNEVRKEYTVSFVARGETYKTVKENGLTLLSAEHPDNISKPDVLYQSIEEIDKADLVLICVKEYDLENICTQLKKVITKDTILLPMMNGADIHERIRNVLADQTILPSCVYVASHIKRKGVIEHKGKTGKLIFGRDPMHLSRDIDWVAQLMSASDINFEFKDNSLIDIWQKFIFIASVGLISAKYNSSIGDACNDPIQKEETRKLMHEIKLIADYKEVGLDADIINKTFEKSSSFPYDTPTSLQLDVNAGKSNNELDLFASAIINYGKASGIETPYTQKIYNELKSKLNIS